MFLPFPLPSSSKAPTINLCLTQVSVPREGCALPLELLLFYLRDCSWLHLNPGADSYLIRFVLSEGILHPICEQQWSSLPAQGDIRCCNGRAAPRGDNSHQRWLFLLVRSNSKVFWGVCLFSIPSFFNLLAPCTALCPVLGSWSVGPSRRHKTWTSLSPVVLTYHPSVLFLFSFQHKTAVPLGTRSVCFKGKTGTVCLLCGLGWGDSNHGAWTPNELEPCPSFGSTSTLVLKAEIKAKGREERWGQWWSHHSWRDLKAV